MSRAASTFVSVLILFMTSTAAGQNSPPSENLKSVFNPHVFEGESGEKLGYRMMRPENESTAQPDQKYPLLLFLHGYGERGDDNTLQLIHLEEFGTPATRENYPAFVVLPQCPAIDGQYWTPKLDPKKDTEFEDEPSRPLSLVMGLLDELTAELPIDEDRVYIMCLSMGGYGFWDLAMRQPDRFAAVIPICASADPSRASSIAHIPSWIFHGGDDQVVLPEHSRTMVKALREAGGTPIYTEYEGIGHDSWVPTFKNRLMWDWLFAQRLSAQR